MNALLVRVAADTGTWGGLWNGPIDSATGKFVYVPIPEDPSRPFRPGLATTYSSVVTPLAGMGCTLPPHLVGAGTHLDPDFSYLTYGDQGARAKRILAMAGKPGDLLVFYAALRDIKTTNLVYAIIGLYVVKKIQPAALVPRTDWHRNAHTRIAKAYINDIVIDAQSGVSGRLDRAIPIGVKNPKNGHYYLDPTLFKTWGGISTKNGWIQRSAYLPEILDPQAFLTWFRSQRPTLSPRNN